MILVQSSDADDRDALVEMLQCEGYRTRAASTESEALAAAAEKRPSLWIRATETSVTLSSACSTSSVARPFRREALLARIVHALAAETAERYAYLEPIAIAC